MINKNLSALISTGVFKLNCQEFSCIARWPVRMKNTVSPLQPEQSFPITCSFWQAVIKSVINGYIPVWCGGCTASCWKKLWHMVKWPATSLGPHCPLSHTICHSCHHHRSSSRLPPTPEVCGLARSSSSAHHRSLFIAQNQVKVLLNVPTRSIAFKQRTNIPGFVLSGATSLCFIFHTWTLIHWLEFDLLFFWNVH